MASLLLLVSVAFAEPPANDNFAEAEDLGSTFPLTTAFSNVEATEEAGDPHVTLSPPEHSVWFRWEAPSDEPVAVDTCRSEFATTLAVFIGSTLNGLTEVGADTNSDGRYCSTASGVAFRAVAGTVYSIMVAGNGFHFPEGPVPTTQGSFELRLAAIPLPPNDDFAHPIPIETSVTTVFDEEFSYSALSDGFTWNATKEPGEPDHAGDPGGASVWYRWTAPRSGHAEISACGTSNTLLGLYTGDVVNALTPVALESRPISCFVNFAATAGMTYKVAVDGKFDSATGLPTMTTFGINASMHISPPSKASIAVQSGPPPDKTPPNTTIRKQVLRSQPSQLVFHFGSNEPGSTFRCKLDKGAFHKCRPLRRVDPAAKGRHVLRVVAVDKAGNVDPTPAMVRFGIVGKSRTDLLRHAVAGDLPSL
jgi:hypothetical protein